MFKRLACAKFSFKIKKNIYSEKFNGLSVIYSRSIGVTFLGVPFMVVEALMKF